MIKSDPDVGPFSSTGSASDTSSASPSTPAKSTKIPEPKSNSKNQTGPDSSAPSPSPKKRKPSTKADDVTPNDGWNPEKRLKLFEAYQRRVAIKWDEVAEDMGQGYTGKQCREQWQRATGKKIRKALEEA